MVELLLRPVERPLDLHERHLHGLEERDLVAEGECLVARHGERECLRELDDGPDESLNAYGLVLVDCRAAATPAPRIRHECAPRLRPDVRLVRRRVGRGPGHDDLHRAALVLVGMPARPELHELGVEVDADPPAHAHHHRIAVDRREPLLEMVEALGDVLELLVDSRALLRIEVELREPALVVDPDGGARRWARSSA